MNVFGFEARLIAAKPHLEHVVIGLKRLVDSCRPPDALCAAVLHCAERFCREHKETARYWSSNEVLCVCEVLDYDQWPWSRSSTKSVVSPRSSWFNNSSGRTMPR
jgi:hypothetical protein